MVSLPSPFFVVNAAVADRRSIIDCAKSGPVEPDVPFPKDGTALHQLLYCVIDSTLWGEDDEDDRFRRDMNHWCLDPSLINRSCQSDNVDPYKYLFKCLSANIIPGINRFPIRYETPPPVGNSTVDPFGKNIVYVEPLLTLACSLLDVIVGSSVGVACLFTYFQSLPSLPHGMPSVTPSGIPSDLPSSYPSYIPSDFPSIVPSDLPSMFPSDLTTELPSVAPTMNVTVEPLSRASSPVVMELQMLLQFVLTDMNIILPPSPGFIRSVTTALNNILRADLEGHQEIAVVNVDYVKDTSDLSVIFRATGRRECVDCMTSQLAQAIETGYEDALKSACRNGTLTSQIEFHSFVFDVPGLANATIDPESVESIVKINRNNKVLDHASIISSAVVNHNVSVLIWICGLAWMKSLLT
jgi:hypothetical protein